MKKNIFAPIFGLLVAASVFAGQNPPPTINITAPTGTVFVSSFPFGANIDMQISHPDGLDKLQVFDVEISQISPVSTPYTQLTQVGNPFDNSGACSNQMIPANKISAC